MTYPPQPGDPGPAYPPPGGQPPFGAPPPYGAPQPPAYGAPQPPAYGAPQSGPPYVAPDSGPPYTGAPQYAAPQYGPPSFGPPGYPPPPPPPRRSRTVPIILSVVAGVLVLCLGGILAVVLVSKNDDSEATGGTITPTTAATDAPAPPATEDAPAPREAKVTITEPRTLGGRPKLNDGQFADLTEEMEKGLASGYRDAGTTFGAFYGRLGTENIVIAIGIETEIDKPEAALAGTFAGIGIGGLEVKNLSPADTGDLGGAAKCGTADASGVDVAVCSWADEGSIGMLMWYFKRAGAVQKEFPKLRAEIETKS